MSQQAAEIEVDVEAKPKRLRVGSAAWLRRWVELIVLFGVGPAVLDLRYFDKALIPLLLALGSAAFIFLLLDKTFDKRRLWSLRGLKEALPRIVMIWAVAAAAMAVFLWLYEPSRLFGFVRAQPEQYAMVMLLYPIFSVVPQGIVFRCFFFHRYEPILAGRWALILTSAAAFGWAHVVLENWIAVSFCAVGGVLFGYTYVKTRSNMAANVEQALYGDFIWTIGLGLYFYSGSLA